MYYGVLRVKMDSLVSGLSCFKKKKKKVCGLRWSFKG